MKLINSSIVFVFQGSAIHSFFLKEIVKRNVLPQELISKAKFDFPFHPTIINLENGYSIHSLPNKIIVQINYTKEVNLNDINSPPDKLTDIANNLKETMELDCKALGINFKVLIPFEDNFPSYKILPDKSEIIDLKYQIKKDIFLVVNTLNRIIIKQNDKTQSGILFDSNFHLELKDEKNKIQVINKALSQRENCLNVLKELTNASFTNT